MLVVYKPFKFYQPVFPLVDVKDLPQMADENRHGYLFVAIEHATRRVFVQARPNKTVASAKAFLAALHKAWQINKTNLLTGSGKEFTDCLFGTREVGQ